MEIFEGEKPEEELAMVSPQEAATASPSLMDVDADVELAVVAPQEEEQQQEEETGSASPPAPEAPEEKENKPDQPNDEEPEKGSPCEQPFEFSSPSLLMLALKAAPLEAAFITDDESDEVFEGFGDSVEPNEAESKALEAMKEEIKAEEAALDSLYESEESESLPGSPGELVIADSSEEPLSPLEIGNRNRRATSIASTADSVVSGGSTASSRTRKFDPTLPIYQKPFQHVADNSIPIPVESFSFAREPLGLNDPKKEIIRNARVKHSPTPPPPPPPKAKRPAVPTPEPKKSGLPNVNGSSGSRPPKRARKSTFQDPVWITAEAKNKLAPCGIRCIKAPGQVPSLQCSSCVCLYHPVCVGLTQLDSRILMGYICNNCRQEKTAPPKPVKVSNVQQVKKEPQVEGPPQSLVTLQGRQYVVVPKSISKPPPPENHEPSGVPAEPTRGASTAASRPEIKKEFSRRETVISNFSSDLNARVGALLQVFSYLTVKELLRASRVCSSWRLIAESRLLWRSLRLKNSGVSSWSDCVQWLNCHKTEAVDLRKMMVPERNPVAAWNEAASSLGQVTSLKAIELGRCSPATVALVADRCPRLTGLSASSLTSSDDMLDLKSLSGMSQLQRLRLRGAYSLRVENLTYLQYLSNLTCLSVTSVKGLPGMDIAVVLNGLPGLELLELGECYEMVQHAEILTEVLAKLQCLKRLRLEFLVTQKPHHESELLVTFFESLTALPHLQHLELVHIEAPPGCDLQIARLSALRSLLLVPSFTHMGSVTCQVLLQGVFQLQRLEQLVIGLTPSICETAQKLYLQKAGRMSPQRAPPPQPHDDCLPVAIPIPSSNALPKTEFDLKPPLNKLDSMEILPAWHLRNLLKEGLPGTKVDVRRLPHPARYSLDEWPLL
ncbi:uncharacterized protein LOC132199480 isoform X2 [Neocloeon triangulifer]|uniref:uncharacterized protein LOC132199480 isoform X2 n=1 Tax=Neocloeon triangulifer TaxID=2078957 RepID=UPI00286F1AEA|nr:uncharacterized protein LOC132199480 isoform X2 [Neocloeon triangulifer]